MDIRAFIAMSESMWADDVLAVIQDYRDEMSKLILKPVKISSRSTSCPDFS
jgi:hypothetical protein